MPGGGDEAAPSRGGRWPPGGGAGGEVPDGGRHLAVVVAYEGTRYAGFQRQRPGVDTVQGRLEAAAAALGADPPAVRGAGRTDAGVHAGGQVVDLWLPRRLPVERVVAALNAHLPDDVVALAVREVAPDFHARFSALSKRYRYLIWTAAAPSPFWRRFAWHRPHALDVEAMGRAAASLVGRRDFSALGASGRPVRSGVRRLEACRLRGCGALLALEVEADGFLYKMVRTMAGTLLEVGRGALAPGEMEAILAGGRRRGVCPTAPAHGLCLERVRYPEGVGPLPAPEAWGAWGPFLDTDAAIQ